MRSLILIATLLLGVSAQAGVIQLNWKNNDKGIDGSTVVINRYFLYWGVQGSPVTNKIDLGAPPVTPISVVGDMKTFRQIMSKPEWTVGATMCFEMTAAVMYGTQLVESIRSNQICRVINPLMPMSPTIVEIQ